MAVNSIIDRVTSELNTTSGLRLHYDPLVQQAIDGSYIPAADLQLVPPLQTFMDAQFPRGFYRHQAEAIQHVLARKHTIVSTRTSSGKSLIYSVPVLDELARDPTSAALFIYPQKALANDQLLKLRGYLSSIPELNGLYKKSPHLVSRYDGATADELKPEIRLKGQILLTTPDMLHYSILQWHELHWGKFLRRLKYVIIDECHEYRGIFGTNVAYVLRRLRQLCANYGASPTFIATSATVSEPRQHLETLTGLPFICIDPQRDGSVQGARKFWIANSADHYYDFGRKLAMQLASAGLSSLVFCPSRVAAERMLSRVRETKDEERSFVRVYRAGLSPEEREEVEAGLRDKSIRVVFSTSALELGIDIGAIDAVICVGLPSSMMSLWQRAGRAARAGKEGAVVFIPGDTPIDSYYAAHPNELFQKENEPLVLNLMNRRVVHQHYACAMREISGDDDQLNCDILGPAIDQVRSLRKEGRLDEEIFYRSDPHMDASIRSLGAGSYILEVGQNPIGEIDEFHLLREAYRNAIYRHGGRSYRVKDVLKGKRKVRLESEHSGHETTPFIQKRIRVKRMKATTSYHDLMIATVAIDVTEFLVNVTEKDRSGKLVNQWPGAAGMAPHTLPTEGTLLQLRKSLWASLTNRLGSQTAKSALQSCERLLWSLFPTVSGPFDIQDFSSASEVQPDGQAAIYLYDLVYDGVDLAIGAFERIDQLIDKAIERVTTCECPTDDGCFRCIANPRFAEPTSKLATRQVLDAIRAILSQEPSAVIRTEPNLADCLSSQPAANCPECMAAVSVDDRFCRNCGHKMEV